jgi:LPXTG-site transpeptidase (sortase) family protein
MIALPPDPGGHRRVQIFLLCAVLIVYLVGFLSIRTALIIVARTTSPQQQEQMTPVHVRIPAINVDAPVIGVALRRDGIMDIPDTAADLGWFELGYRPGEQGNAVIAGHLDTASGKPAVFWDLRRLKKGDKIYVVADDGTTRTFVVRERETYPMDDAPMQRIFGVSSGAHLNLITCNGQWQEHLNTYARRLVVYTDEVIENGETNVE